MEIILKLVVLESYSTAYEEKVSIEFDDLIKPSLIQQAVNDIFNLARQKGMMDASFDRCADMYASWKANRARSEGVKEGKGKAEDSWKIQSELTKLQEEHAKKECQVKGLIQTVDQLIAERNKADDNRTD